MVVADVLHPVDNFAVERFLNGDMRHGDCWTCTMPVFLSGLEPDDVARPDFFDRAAPPLDPPGP